LRFFRDIYGIIGSSLGLLGFFGIFDDYVRILGFFGIFRDFQGLLGFFRDFEGSLDLGWDCWDSLGSLMII